MPGTHETNAHERDQTQNITHGTMPPVCGSETGTAAVWSVHRGGSPGARGAAAKEAARERGAGVPQPSVSEGVAQAGQLYRDSVPLGSEHVSQVFSILQGRAGKNISCKRLCFQKHSYAVVQTARQKRARAARGTHAAPGARGLCGSRPIHRTGRAWEGGSG